MWVGFLYTNVIRVLLGSDETRVSRKGVEPSSLGFSVVNWIWRSLELMYWMNW